MITKFKLFELVDYNEVDYDQKTYNGNLYLYSDEPLKLEDIDFSNLNHLKRIYLTNRADASDINSEYIYQIKTKKPLYKQIVDFFGFSEDEEVDVDDYSGYFYKHSITGEWLARIKNGDVISFRYIGGFTKYDKHTPERINVELSEKTDDWLYSYIGSGSLLLSKLTQDIIDELKPFKPDKPLKIYKGIEEVQIKHFSKKTPPYKVGEKVISDFNMSTSWTTNILVARRFVDEQPSSPPFVIMMEVQPKDVLVDVQKLPTQYYHTNQREIILLPGKYEYKIVWEGELN